MLDALCAEENELLNLETHRREADKNAKGMAPHLKSLQSALEKQTRQLQRVQTLRSQFVNMEEQISDESPSEVVQDQNMRSEVVQDQDMTSEVVQDKHVISEIVQEKHTISAEITSAETAIMGGA